MGGNACQTAPGQSKSGGSHPGTWFWSMTVKLTWGVSAWPVQGRPEGWRKRLLALANLYLRFAENIRLDALCIRKMAHVSLPPLHARQRVPPHAKRVPSRASGSQHASACHPAVRSTAPRVSPDTSTAADVGGRCFRQESHGMLRVSWSVRLPVCPWSSPVAAQRLF